MVGAVIGPYGFFLLGLSLTFTRVPQPPEELRRAARRRRDQVRRRAAGPARDRRLLGADVPGVFYLLAGMPSAFHLLVLARVYEVRPALMNRIVVGTTIPAVAAVVLVVGIARVDDPRQRVDHGGSKCVPAHRCSSASASWADRPAR